MAAAFAAFRGPSRTAEVHFGCGKPGHLKRDCPTLKEEKPKFTFCSPCHRGLHFAHQCHSQHDFKGHQIQGNQNRREGWCCTQTQMPQLPQMLLPQMPTLQVPNRGLPQVFA
ncbi:POK9 protein, partial [Alaudala cheleensis]|nr:POK9 protein [Alaudala cheleensis]